MENKVEIKEKLEELYHKYKNNKNKLNKEQTVNAAILLKELAVSEETTYAAKQLARFTEGVSREFFSVLTADGSVSDEVVYEMLDLIIEVYQKENNQQNKNNMLGKFLAAAESILKNNREIACSSTQLPIMISLAAQAAFSLDTLMNKFRAFVVNSEGGLYLLDYSGVSEYAIGNIWSITNKIYPDILRSKYLALITQWAEKNHIDIPNADSSAKTEIKEQKAPLLTKSEKKEDSALSQKTISASEKTVPVNEPGSSEINIDNEADKCIAFPGNMPEVIARKTIEDVISAVNTSADSVIKSVAEMFAKANDDREKAAECDRLRSRLSESEKKITEQESIITELREKNSASVSKCEGAIKKSEELEAQNAELEEKLREAYSINSREESLEAEKIRSELKKAFMYLYEDWLDYEFSDVSEENYESLQAIIKKIFRVLERNGIDFKEKK